MSVLNKTEVQTCGSFPIEKKTRSKLHGPNISPLNFF